ncbi:sodium:dicarboxylate symporter [Anoxybacter fermentans]|uniref:Sodium:dicarboxylate symporter n=2 Tax=Anoxybacter fermentans TaxID=1323375 RepID=A0A3S9T2Y1_9FIRM|nr:sodium:dicarboxylate symporter [Anoxybacter fermentans]
MTLTTQIFIALLAGVVFGVIANLFLSQEVYQALEKWILTPVGNIFIRGIRMMVVPLVLISLACGAAGIGDLKKLGRIGGKTLIFYMSTTAIAITIGLILAYIINPGIGINLSSEAAFQSKTPPFIMDVLTDIIPTNPFAAMTEGNMLQIILFAILTGIAIAYVGEKAQPILELANILNEVMIKMVSIVLVFAPYGVFALIAKVIASQGLEIILPLIKYMSTVLLALLLHTTITYSSALTLLARVNPLTFFKKFSPTMMVAFSTSSSNATLPVTIETVESKLGVSNEICSFTLPLGATINMDGTSIMQGVATIFIAQVFGIDLSFQALLMVILTATLASIGTAGVPGVGLITLSMVLQSVGLPVEGIALIIGVDRILDMTRTVVNITGDAVATIVIGNSEGAFDRVKFNS